MRLSTIIAVSDESLNRICRELIVAGCWPVWGYVVLVLDTLERAGVDSEVFYCEADIFSVVVGGFADTNA